MQPLNFSKLGLMAGILTLTLGIALNPGLSVAGTGDAWLGVSLQDLNRDLRDALDLGSSTRGTLINSVIDDSPAEEAGLRSNDVITAVDGHRVDNFDDLVEILNDREPGETVTIDVIRGDNTRSFEVRLGDKEDAQDLPFSGRGRGFFSGDDGSITIDLDDLKDGGWKDLLGGNIQVDVDEGDGRIEIIITDEGDDDDRRVIILSDGDEDDLRSGKGHVFIKRHKEIIQRHGDDGPGADCDTPCCHKNKGKRLFKHNQAFTWHNDTAFLGVSTTTLGDQLAAYFGVSPGEGVLIEQVVEDSPAEKAGFRAGDIILRVDKEEIADPTDLLQEIRDREEGDTVDIDVLRDKKKRTITVTLGETDDFGFLMDLEELGPRLHAMGRELRHRIPERLELHRIQEDMRRVQRGAHRAHRDARRVLREAQEQLHLDFEDSEY